jgi:hypothetical protein
MNSSIGLNNEGEGEDEDEDASKEKDEGEVTESIIKIRLINYFTER